MLKILSIVASFAVLIADEDAEHNDSDDEQEDTAEPKQGKCECERRSAWGGGGCFGGTIAKR
jgi:hypothetical protein